MGYRSEIYQRAFKIKNDAVKKAQNEYEKQLIELRLKNEDFCVVEMGLAKLGPAIALAAISSDDEKLAEFKEMSDTLNAKYRQILSSENINRPHFFCDKCEDSGYVGNDYCSCIRDIAKALVAEELSRTMPLGDCRFDNFELDYYPDRPDTKGNNPRKRAATILNLCKKFVADFPNGVRSLLFMGETGLGKTHLSLAIVSAVSDKGYSVVYGPAGKLFSAVEKEHFSYSGDTEKRDSLLECDLLVIDDLGTEFLSAFTVSLVNDIIDSRLLEGKPTIISTNLSIDEIEKRYSQRVASRLMGNYDTKRFIGSDIRQQKAFNK